MADFLGRHPAVEIELNLTDRFVDLVDEGYDAMLRLGPIGDTSLTVRELAAHDQIACASPAYLTRRSAPKTPQDLADHDCLGFVNWSGRPFAQWRFGRRGKIDAVEIHSRFQVNDGRVLVAAAMAGHGIILQPRAVVADALNRGALIPALVDYVAPSRTLYLLHTPQEPQPTKLRAFVEHLVIALASQEPAFPNALLSS